MSGVRTLLLTRAVFEGVSGRCSFPCQRLFIQGFVSLRFQIKGPLADRLESPLLGAFEVLAVGSTLWLLGHAIVMSFKNLMNEGNHRRPNFSVATTIAILGKQA